MLCYYYTANLQRQNAWFVAGVLRNETHTVLDRCLDKTNCKFEFFVPSDCQTHFLRVMLLLERRGLVFNLELKPNRLSKQL